MPEHNWPRPLSTKGAGETQRAPDRENCYNAGFLAEEAWFRTFLDLPNGIPSHDTLGKVLATLDPDAFEQRIQQWIHALVGSNTEGKHIAIDAMGCQRDIAQKIIERGGHYLFALKGNQSALQKDAQTFMDDVIARGATRHCDCYETTEKSHGRIEKRTRWSCWDIDWLAQRQNWPGLSCMVVLECTRTVNGKTSTERRYFISSHSGRQAQKLAVLIRNHWRVENELHWTLDVSFNEDQCRVRIENAAENLSRIRRITLLLLKNDRTCKLGIKSKRAKAGYDRNYLLTLLGFHPGNQKTSP